MFTYKAAAISDAGTVKPTNQDSYSLKMGAFDNEYFIMAIVADGMGGVSEGEIASRSLSAAFSNWFHSCLEKLLRKTKKKNIPLEELLIEDWESIISDINLELYEYSKNQGYELGEGPGSTICGIFLYGGTYYVINIGDSRAYKKSDRIKQITTDHSWAEMAREEGLSEEQIARDYRANKVTRCIGCGMKEMPEADYFAGSYQPGDYFLLCSDGLRRVIDNKDMEMILSAKDGDTREKCAVAVELAKENGETDNITAVIVEIGRSEDADKEETITNIAEGTYIETNEHITEELKVKEE